MLSCGGPFTPPRNLASVWLRPTESAKTLVRGTTDQCLEAEPNRWDLSSLFIITSSGVMFSEPTKQGLIKHLPTMMIVDAFSSSEAVGGIPSAS